MQQAPSNSRSRISWAAPGLAGVALLFTACTPATPAPVATQGQASPTAPAGSRTQTAGIPATGSAVPTGAESPRAGGRVIVGTFSDVKTFNPVLESDNVSASVIRRIYERLLSFDYQSAEPRPGLAERWDVSPDGKRYTFTLREGITWSDGSPLTGEDVAFSAQAVMRSQKTARKSIFQDIVGAREFGTGAAEGISGIKIDGRNVTIELTQASCPALFSLGNFPILPKAEFGKYLDPKDASKNLDEAPENSAPKLASGPFKFKEWLPNDHVTLVRNDTYFRGKPLLDEYVHRPVPDATALAAGLRRGEIDVSAAVNAKDIEDLRQANTLDVQTYLSPSYTYIGWNQLRGGKEFLQSKLVRQALAYGLNMQQVVDRVYFGEGQKMVTPMPPVSWAYNEQGLNPYAYDTARAQALLEQDGWRRGADGVFAKDGERLSFEIVTNSGNAARETLLQVAAEQYKQIGVEITPRTEAFEALVDRLQQSKDPRYGDQGGHDFDAVIIGFSLDPEPDPFTIWHSSETGTGKFNFIGYKNPEVDKLIEDGRTKCDLADRKAAYDRFNKILNEEQPYNFGLAAKTVFTANKKFQNVKPGPWTNREEGFLWNIHEWWIRQ